MEYRIEQFVPSKSPNIAGTCPCCGRTGVFEEIGVPDVHARNMFFGQRRCPSPSCWAHIFFIRRGNEITTYPPQRIDFEKEGIPERVLLAFEEAVTCHANQCYIASAIMIRKTLEEVCLDREAKGDDLKKRIQALGSKIMIPKELVDGMDELRLLGNDAAHFKSREFEKVEKEEVEVGLDFAKEILKAVYLYDKLLRKMRGLRKDNTSTQI